MRGIPTEDILSICTTLDQKWGHQVLGIMLWGDQTGPLDEKWGHQVLGIMLWGLEADFDLGGHLNEVEGLFL